MEVVKLQLLLFTAFPATQLVTTKYMLGLIRLPYVDANIHYEAHMKSTSMLPSFEA